ncbi:protein BLISTER isoform X4 [Citrus sinensis]|uniref:protein BLISTER isoform X4 n=1 Tax=Citrus sinensis TaxID=2711 RepID=UPI002278C12B|nr:protein BLISTER isoform X4 [Citrus sinensis]
MASAQVLPTSRKQEHLEAGKRKLEEFRKKKAAERSKKASSVSQPQASDFSLHDQHHLEADRVRVTDSDGAGTSDGPDKAVVNLPLVMHNDDNKALKLAQQSQQVSLSDKHINSNSFEYDLNSSSAYLAKTYSNNQETSGSAGPVNVSNSQETKDVNNDFVIYSSGQGRLRDGIMSNQFVSLLPEASQDYDSSNSSKSGFQGIEESQSKGNDSFPKVPTLVNSGPSHDFVTKISPQNSVSTLFQSKPSNAIALGNGHSFHSSSEGTAHLTTSTGGSASEVGLNTPSTTNFSDPVSFNTGEGKPSNSASGLASLQSTPFKRSEYSDSLNVPRASSGTLFERTEPERDSFMSSSSLNSMDVLGSSPAQKPSMEKETTGAFSKTTTSNIPSAFDFLGNPTVSASDRGDIRRLGSNESTIENQHGFYSTKHNEDFAALEQHIEDLTQEKFALQRSLEASRTLSESLAAENSSLTDSYNQQRSVVNQLKSEMEKLQEEIKVQLVELESFRNEYANVRLECNAADERAKILASEVIGLEEKALRLRSNELKLERQLENSQSEISSYKKKISSLEKERQDFQSTIEALQEEKKMMQSKLRKASGSGKSIDFGKTAASTVNASTSTEDLAIADTTLDNSNQDTHDDASLPRIDASGSTLPPESGRLALESLAVNIPHDQMRMIHNINALISELALEKEELVQALSSELAQSSKLKDLNNEMSRKLEHQTQRLELLTAQNMANENISIRQPDSASTHDHTAYADEGDEVVERVLGWIMKLFPGGPSRRRTSKLL